MMHGQKNIKLLS